MTATHQPASSTSAGGRDGLLDSQAANNHANRLNAPTRRVLAVLRLAFGFTFLWAFFDKLFALGFHTGYG